MVNDRVKVKTCGNIAALDAWSTGVSSAQPRVGETPTPRCCNQCGLKPLYQAKIEPLPLSHKP
jgi:hypothetical protein